MRDSESDQPRDVLTEDEARDRAARVSECYYSISLDQIGRAHV